ncbi:MAG TPA: molybdopterin cofactor-binding domain-containing protein, partial [Xanthobacteraceae bacterium]
MTISDTASLNRRAFLSATGALVVTLASSADWADAASETGIVADRPPLKGDKLSSYITIDADGTVVAYYGKIDGGQGLETSIAQMVAEEIDVPFEHVRIVMGDSALTMDMGGASAAIGVSHGGMMLRRTAAEARRLLIEMASQKLGVPASDLTVTDGVIHDVKDASKRVSYAELIGGRYFNAPIKWNGKLAGALKVETTAPLKTPAEFKVIGQSYRRRDLPGKVFATLEYVNDVRLPNMLHARMIRPAVAGAVPVKVDDASIKDIPGAKVVWIKDLLAVVAEKEWNAVKAAKA